MRVFLKWLRRERRCALSDEIGYCNPPKKTQFKKGQSGNPKGRPKGSKEISPIEKLYENLMNEIILREGGVEKTVTVLEAIQKRLITESLKGNMTAIRLMQKQFDILDRKAIKRAPMAASETSIKVEFVKPEN